MSISDIGVSAIAQGCPQLTSINLQDCKGMSDIGVSAIAQGCPLLTSINLYACSGHTRTTLSFLKRNYPHIKLHLSLF